MEIVFTIVGIVAVFLMWVMLFDSNRFVVVRYKLTDERIKRPMRLVVLADLHNKQYGKENQNLIEAIRGEKPDAILVAGDLVTAKLGLKTKEALGLLRELSKDYPVYYANGNHEQRMELAPEEFGPMAFQYGEELKAMGVDRLVNEHVALEGAGIVLYGLEIDRDFYQKFRPKDMGCGYLEKLLGKPDPGRFTILIAHHPNYFPCYADWGADLVLSGHIHGGVARIPGGRGVISPAFRLFPHYDGGRFELGGSVMLLSRGLGMHTIPIRLFNPGEVVVAELLPRENGG